MRLHVPVPLRWGDLDAYGHVNNVAMLRLLEEARIAAFWRHPGTVEGSADLGVPTAVLDAGPTASTHTLVARSEIEYLVPLPYRREPAVVEMWLGHLGGASIDVCYEITSGEEEPRQVYARAVTTLVLIDAATQRPRRLTDDERAVWGRYLGDPPALRRRPGS
ncbi:4-hydroxybenzoyl-CoA thioesterase [Actinotalea ferrariae CF5-4]|uniref:4-hydroxybenzoyl-CoA thioesterase n=1 Tax=Actinotalea ferrariae CF5-4 TaxID=948458 RepID=A0A021VWX8_9CELL|nr:thioesterase family protein [Actinotalea ferrariae]EYR64520.1 4-hydroxybenzoyl-CoA thioesterase [Actinotalea ferrariae CF5-4]